MRPEELVRRAGQEVRLDGLHVDRTVRREMDRVDERPRADGMRPANDLGDRVDRPDRVRGPAEGNEARPWAERRVEDRARRDVVVADVDDAHRRPPVGGHEQPRIHVGLVIERGDDDLVPRPEGRPRSTG